MTDETLATAVDAAADTTAAAANPDTQAGTDPAKVEGQGQAEAGKVEADKAEADAGVPEAYAPFTLPEGYTLEGERLEAAQAKFKALGLSQDKAQELVDFYCQADGENASIRQTFLDTERQQRIEGWGAQAKEVFGAKYDETITLARAGVAAVNSPELLEAFNAEGWGNHPELIKAFAKLGEMARGSGPKGLESETTRAQPLSRAERMYPDLAKR